MALFVGHLKLRELVVRSNRLEKIVNSIMDVRRRSQQAGSGKDDVIDASVLLTLDLADNKLTGLMSEKAFWGFGGSLQQLDLSANLLTDIGRSLVGCHQVFIYQ